MDTILLPCTFPGLTEPPSHLSCPGSSCCLGMPLPQERRAQGTPRLRLSGPGVHPPQAAPSSRITATFLPTPKGTLQRER